MLERLLDTALLVRNDAGEVEAGRNVVDQHDVDVLLLQFSDQAGLGVACEDGAFDLLAARGALPILGSGDQQLVFHAVGPAHDAFADACVELVQKCGAFLARAISLGW